MVALTLPASALAAPPSVTGPAGVGESAGKAVYTVNCGDAPGPLPTIVPYSGTLTVTISAGPAPSATAGTDHGDPTPAAVVCSAGTRTHSVQVPILDDAAVDAGERYKLTVSGSLTALGGNPPTATVAESVTTTILDDDLEAGITDLVRVMEGDSGTSAAQLSVSLSDTPAQPVTLAYSTEDASATRDSDYVATAGEVVIPAGHTSATITVAIVGDTIPERPEGFYVNLTSADNARLDPTKKQGAVAIFDNDRAPAPQISIARGVEIAEGKRGLVNALFPVTLSRALAQRVQVNWKTANWSANLADYARGRGTLVFEPGETSKTVSVNVKGDRRDERDEAFGVVLSDPVGATIARKAGFGIITDDDGPKMSIGRPEPARRAIVTRLGCPASADTCKGRLVATAKGRTIGSVRFALAKGRHASLKLTLTRRARAILRGRAVRVKLAATAADASGAKRRTGRTFRLPAA